MGSKAKPKMDDLVRSIGDIVKARDLLARQAERQYAPEVEGVLRTECRDPNRIEHLLDGILDFCFDPEMLCLYKKLCRYYFTIDPEATASYVKAYREMWDEGEGNLGGGMGEMKAVEGWKKYRIREVCDLGRERVISGQEIESNPGIFPVYSSQSSNSGKMGSIDTFDFDGEYVTWTTDGAYAGTVFYRIGKFNCTNVCGTLRAKVPDISMPFIAYELSTLTKNHVSYVGNPKLMNGVMANIEILVPTSLAEQAKIAEILSTVDRAIEQTEILIAKQQRIKTGLMQDLLTRGIDEHGNLRSEQTHRFKDSPLGRIPVEWTPSQIGSAATLQRGHDITENDLRDGPYPVISSSGVIGYHAECTSKGPNVVVGRKGTIGRVHYLEHDFWAHDTSLYVTSFKGNNERYIFYLFSYLDLARYGTKSGSPSLNRNDIHPLWIGLPSPDEQSMIATILKSYDHSLDSLDRDLEKLRSFKTALMQDLLTGRKRITALIDDVGVTN